MQFLEQRAARRGRKKLELDVNDLPRMREALGDSAPDENKKKQAKKFAKALDDAEDSLFLENWRDLRRKAYDICEEALTACQDDQITEADYNSIANQAEIMVRGIPTLVTAALHDRDNGE